MRTPLTSKYLAFLRRKGISYREDSDGDFEFFYQGIFYYFITYSNTELPYFRLVQFCVDDASADTAICHQACEMVTRDIRVIKAYVDHQGQVCFSLETFIPKGVADIEVLFERFFSIFGDANEEYKKNKEKLLDEQAKAVRDLPPQLFDFDPDDDDSEASSLPEPQVDIPDADKVDFSTLSMDDLANLVASADAEPKSEEPAASFDAEPKCEDSSASVTSTPDPKGKKSSASASSAPDPEGIDLETYQRMIDSDQVSQVRKRK